MIYEIARIKVKPGLESDFEKALKVLASGLKRAKGCHGSEFHRSVDQPGTYHDIARWETVANHMVDFRNTPDWAEWARLSRPCFDGAPALDHAELLGDKG